jgi:anti-anti-sigma factor
MSVSPIHSNVQTLHRSARCAPETNEERVADFYCSSGPCFFGAVVSTRSATDRADSEPAPVRVTLIGELDVTTAPLLRDCFARIDGDVDVDCSGLEFVDAHGLGVFVSARTRCEPNGRFVLVEPASCLSRLLRITGLDASLEIRFETEPVR